MDVSLRATLRATLFGLHAGAVFAGTECLLIWVLFRWEPAATVGGVAYAVGGLLSLLAYPRTYARTMRVILMRGLRAFVYSVALFIVGALLLRSGSHGFVAHQARGAFSFASLMEATLASDILPRVSSRADRSRLSNRAGKSTRHGAPASRRRAAGAPSRVLNGTAWCRSRSEYSGQRRC
jgi:hypothetical protein